MKAAQFYRTGKFVRSRCSEHEKQLELGCQAVCDDVCIALFQQQSTTDKHVDCDVSNCPTVAKRPSVARSSDSSPRESYCPDKLNERPPSGVARILVEEGHGRGYLFL